MSHPTILIVENDKDMACLLTIRLRQAGYQVVTAFDAVLALSTARRCKPELAVLNVDVRGGDGFEVGRRLKASGATAGIQLIYVSASGRPGLRERAAQQGAVGFFERPYEASTLVDAVHAALRVEGGA